LFFGGPNPLIEHVFRVSKGWKASSYAEPMLPAVDTYIEVLMVSRLIPQVASSTMAAGSD
jgi:hypothetical protein